MHPRGNSEHAGVWILRPTDRATLVRLAVPKRCLFYTQEHGSCLSYYVTAGWRLTVLVARVGLQLSGPGQFLVGATTARRHPRARATGGSIRPRSSLVESAALGLARADGPGSGGAGERVSLSWIVYATVPCRVALRSKLGER